MSIEEIIDILDKASKILASKFDDYMIHLENKHTLMIKLAHGEISVVQSWNDTVLEAYLAKDKKIGIYNLSPEKIGEDAERALKDISRLKPSPFYAELPSPTGEELSRVDEKIKEASTTANAEFLVEDLGLKNLGDAAGMIRLSYIDEYLRGSNGADLSSEKTKFDGYMRIFGEKCSGQWGWTSTTYNPEKALKSINNASSLARECDKLQKTKLEPGEYRVLLGPMIVGNLMDYVSMSASAGSLVYGLSFLLTNKPGDKVASEKLTLRDTPRNTDLPGFSGYDLEGVATHDKPIIENGVLQTFLHNSKTAKYMKTKTTGNAGWVFPEPFNLEIGPGNLKLDEALEALGNGYYLTNNWYTRFQNYVEGTFSTVTRDAAFKVRNGEIIGYVERIRIADQMPRLLNNIEELTRERHPIEWWEVRKPTLTPYVLVSRLKLTSPEI